MAAAAQAPLQTAQAPDGLAQQQALAPTVLLAYASHFGQAQRIAYAVAEQLHTHGVATHCIALADAPTTQPLAGPWQAVLVIASVRYGNFSRSVAAFIQAQQAAAPHTPWGFASVSLTARKPEKCSPSSHRNTQQFLAQLHGKGLQPQWCAVFAGALQYPRYGWLDKNMIRLIMRMTGGITDTRQELEYTDWQAVHAWADQVALGLPGPQAL